MVLQEFYGKAEQELVKLYNKQEYDAILKRLASCVLACSEVELLLKKQEIVPPEQMTLLEEGLQKLIQGMPIQYVLGETNFYGLDLYVEEGVLIPRQETEELVDWIVKMEKNALQILDVGVGSGCITAALSKHLKNTHLTALDISLQALDLARENCDRYQLRPTFLYGDILEWQNFGLSTYDVIVSNPPYIREKEKAFMHTNVLDFEPHTALFVANENPLLFYRAIAEMGQKHLAKRGRLYFEINETLAEEVMSLLSELGYKNIELRQDLNGKDRMVRSEYGV